MKVFVLIRWDLYLSVSQCQNLIRYLLFVLQHFWKRMKQTTVLNTRKTYIFIIQPSRINHLILSESGFRLGMVVFSILRLFQYYIKNKIPVDSWFKLNILYTFIWHHSLQMNTLCKFNFGFVSTEICHPFTVWNMSKYGVFSGPYFPAFGLNTERYFVSLRIQSECRKIRTRKYITCYCAYKYLSCIGRRSEFFWKTISLRIF